MCFPDACNYKNWLINESSVNYWLMATHVLLDDDGIDFEHACKVKHCTLLDAWNFVLVWIAYYTVKVRSILVIYCTPSVINCNLYIFHPNFEVHFLVFMAFFSENSVLMLWLVFKGGWQSRVGLVHIRYFVYVRLTKRFIKLIFFKIINIES